MFDERLWLLLPRPLLVGLIATASVSSSVVCAARMNLHRSSPTSPHHTTPGLPCSALRCSELQATQRSASLPLALFHTSKTGTGLQENLFLSPHKSSTFKVSWLLLTQR